MKTEKLYDYVYYSLFLIGIAFFLYSISDYTIIKPIWEYFPDSKDYKTQSEFSLFSLDFFAPLPSPGFSPRPFTVSLFYKIVLSDPYKMIFLQKAVYSISVLAFIYSFLMYLSNRWVKLMTFYILLYFFTWWSIVGWTENILSESLSMSFMFLWFTVILYYYKKQSLFSFFILVFITFLFSFTRDTWPYIILLFSLINLLLVKFNGKNLLKQSAIFLLFSVSVFFIQNYTASRGERYKLPVFNSIAERVSKKDEYLLWFKNEGMPLADKLKADFKNINIDDEENRQIVYSKYDDSEYKPLFNWIVKDGKKVYQKFLLTHWSCFFLSDQDSEQKNRIFCSNLQGYTKKPEGFFLNADATFPYFSFLSCVIFITLALVLILLKRDVIFLFPISLAILFTANALISYNADALEVKRHLFITQIVLEFICLTSLFLILDNVRLLKTVIKKKNSD